MKKFKKNRACFLLVIAALSFSGLKTHAQPYQSIFGKNSTVFHIFTVITSYVSSEDVDTTNLLGVGITMEYKFYPQDTATYNDKLYYYSGSEMYLCVREDTSTGQLFRYFVEEDKEFLICDMTLQPGDTFIFPKFNELCHHCYCWEQDELFIVDSVSYTDGKKTIHFPKLKKGSFYSDHLDHIDKDFHLTFTEGLGPSYGVLGCPAVQFGENYLGLLLCAEKDSVLVYVTSPRLGCFQAAVSVEQFEADILLLSPNPVETTLKIHISDPAVLGGQLFITDIHGGVRWQGAMNEDVVILDFTNYTPGVYIAHYITKNKKASKKIIKI